MTTPTLSASCLCLPLFGPGTLARAAEFSANRYGAKGDGVAIETAAIHLRIDEGVVIQGVQDQAACPVMATRIAGIVMNWPAALINVYEQSSLTISGKGVIDGTADGSFVSVKDSGRITGLPGK